MVERFGSGGVYEEVVGYSRTVRIASRVLVSGCTSLGPDGVVRYPGDAAGQAWAAISGCRRGLALAGADLEDVVLTRVYLTDISRWEEVGRAHGEAFGAIRPVTTMVEVSALIDPRMLVEIEAEAHHPR